MGLGYRAWEKARLFKGEVWALNPKPYTQWALEALFAFEAPSEMHSLNWIQPQAKP